MAQISGLPARRAALRLLDAVLRNGETIDAAEYGALGGVPEFADRALARAIAGEVLRWLVDLDALIDSATRKPLPDHAKPRMVLRMMLAQSLRLETPGHAVIATCLPLLAGGHRRLAHGVFSTLDKKEPKLPDHPTLPDWVNYRWGEKAQSVAKGLGNPPALDLRLKDPSQTEKWTEELGGTSLASGHVRLARGGAIIEMPGFHEGDWWVQDLAASIPVQLLGKPEDAAGKRALDLCAAPGGKTLQLAAAGWEVTALDLSAKRLKTVEQNLERTKLEAEIVSANALTWNPKELFDVILLDAPCTATGTCRRHPDVLHRIGEEQIEEMANLQGRLLAKAAGWLKPGGQLVYAVCSMEKEEGEEVAAKLELESVPITAEELPAGLQPSEQGWLRTDPGMLGEQGGLDGFFVARWRNKA